jgi:hypothetical protein
MITCLALRRFARTVGRLACAALLLAACGGQAPPATTAPSAGTGQLTFGTAECGKLVAIQEVEAALGQTVGLINIVEENVCDYEDDSGFVLLTVSVAREPAGDLACAEPDGTYLGQPAEGVAGLGDEAVWSEAVGTLCFVKGGARAVFQFGLPAPAGRDGKSVMVDLARKAIGRLP